MPVFPLSKELIFPPVHLASRDGRLARGGDLSPERLLLAYQSGIFPWFSQGEPILWWSPNPRFVLFPEEVHISHSMKSLLKKNPFEFSINTAFTEVMRACSDAPRDGQYGTWISEEMIAAYSTLHRQGHALSAECRLNGQLVGGLYGVLLDRVFCGESMFSNLPNASKFAFLRLAPYLQARGIQLIDCQVYTPHLESLGARFIARDHFLSYLQTS